jgi:hypothetical protein
MEWQTKALRGKLRAAFPMGRLAKPSQPSLTGRGTGTHRALALLQVSDQSIYPLDGEWIEALVHQSPVMRNFGLKLIAFLAHGTPRWTGRERAALSVTGRYQGRIDDALGIAAVSGSDRAILHIA